MFALASFVGFEATAIYGEESRNPTRTVPLATYAAVSIIMIFFAFVTWAIISSYGVDHVVAAAFADPGNFWFAKSDEYLGRVRHRDYAGAAAEQHLCLPAGFS